MGRGEAAMFVIKFFRKTSLTYQCIKTSHSSKYSRKYTVNYSKIYK